MPSTIEMIDKQTGLLPPEYVIASELTRVISNLHTVMVMLPSDSATAAKQAIEFNRIALTEIRSYLETHFAFKPKQPKG